MRHCTSHSRASIASVKLSQDDQQKFRDAMMLLHLHLLSAIMSTSPGPANKHSSFRLSGWALKDPSKETHSLQAILSACMTTVSLNPMHMSVSIPFQAI